MNRRTIAVAWAWASAGLLPALKSAVRIAEALGVLPVLVDPLGTPRLLVLHPAQPEWVRKIEHVAIPGRLALRPLEPA